MIPPPQIPDSEWLDLTSPGTLREGKSLADNATNIVWDAPFLRGNVADNGQNFRAELDLRSRTIPRVSCACENGRARKICRHALAVYFAYFAPLIKAAEAARAAAALRKISSEKISAPAPVFKNENRGAQSLPSRFENAENARPKIDGGSEWISVVLPARNAPCFDALHDLLKRSGFVEDSRSRRWFLRGTHEFLNFFAEQKSFLENDCRAEFSPTFRHALQKFETAKILCDATPSGNDGAFDFSAKLSARGATDTELAAAVVRGMRYLHASNGKTVLIPDATLEKIAALRERFGGEDFSGTPTAFFRRFSKEEIPAAATILEKSNVAFDAPEDWRSRAAALRNLSKLEKPPVPETLFSRLRAYQQIGTAWLWHLHKNKLCGLLADEMGLGKTVETIAYLAAVFSEEAGDDTRALLVVPAGLIENWRRELARFAPEIPVRVHHGQRRAEEARVPFPRGVVITSYSTLALDIVFFRSKKWHTVVADEAQQIKNRRSRNARALKELFAETRFVLTGTPIENSHEDLRSLFEFLMPGLLPPRTDGAAPASRREWSRETLRELVAPYILRRTKSAVAPELPPKIEQTVWCRFGEAQAKLYEERKTRSREEIFNLEMAGASDAKLRVAAFSKLLRLRQICTDPRVIIPDFPAENSTKLRAFLELLDEARAGNHRMIVFSQFVSVLDLVAETLVADEIPFCRIDGSTRDRARECARFNDSPNIPVFLVSLKAGGLGLNITGADTVVLYDPWWNPAAETQAIDRAHRIGQTRAVNVIKLVVADSVEERVLSLQLEKRRLLEELFEAASPSSAKISLDAIKELLA